MKVILPFPNGNSSKENLVLMKENYEALSPQVHKSNQVIDLKQANYIQTLVHRGNNDSKIDSKYEINHSKNEINHSSPGSKTNNKQKHKGRPSHRLKPENQQQTIEDAKLYGFQGRPFKYNAELETSIYDDFLYFPWENYNHDDFFSFMVAKSKNIKQYLEFYKSHARHSDFLRKNQTEEVHPKFSDFLGSDKESICQVILTQSNKEILTASNNGEIRRFNFENGNLNDSYISHSEAATCIVVTKDEKLLISGSKDNSIRVWELNNSANLKVQKDAHTDYVMALALCNDDQNLLSGLKINFY